MRAQLKDPDSAEFRDVKQPTPGNWCGYVNAKNSYGGYVGYRFFRYDGKTVDISTDDDLSFMDQDPAAKEQVEEARRALEVC